MTRFALLMLLMLTGGPAGIWAADSLADDPASEPTVRAVQRVLPAVVNINTEHIERLNLRDPFESFFHDFFRAPTMRPPRTVEQRVQSLGSGFLVDPEGYIVTNDHVVARAAGHRIHITTHDGRTFDGVYLAGDPGADLAFLKIESDQPLPHVDLEALSPNHLGQTVIAMGNPLGYGTTVTRGILSAHNRTVTIQNMEFTNLLQTDVAINPGNSGGPIIDLAGQLVGVSSVKMAYSAEGVPLQGMGFAIPGETVRDKVQEFIQRARRGPQPGAPPAVPSRAEAAFGMNWQELTDDLAKAFGVVPRQGVLISHVDPHGPAGRAGLEPGLVIYKIGRHEISSLSQAEQILERVRPGVAVDFIVGLRRPVGGPYIQENVRRVRMTARPGR